jgi:hypothetical protein
VRSVPALNKRLEFYIIPRERAHGVIDNFACERRVEHQRGVRIWWPVGAVGRQACSTDLKGKIPAEVMRNGVGNPHVLEGTGGDVIIVTWVTPRTKAVVIGVRPDRCVVKVRSV